MMTDVFFFRNLLHPLIHFDVDRPVPKNKIDASVAKTNHLLRGPFSVLWAKLLWVWGGLKSLGGKNKRRTL